jgi:hypothetical protein
MFRGASICSEPSRATASSELVSNEIDERNVQFEKHSEQTS